MNKRQKLFLVAVAVACSVILAGLTFGALTGGSEGEAGTTIVVTFYPLAYVAESIGGEKVSVHALIPPNTETHTWAPSTTDILQAQDADILMYNGAGLEPWFEEDILPALDIEQKIVVDTTEGLTLLPGGESESYDPHTWLSPYMLRMQAEKVLSALVVSDPTNATYYSERWTSLDEALGLLDASYNDTLSSSTKSAVFVSHAAYGYLADRYGFTQYGIIGLSADEEPSTSTIATLVEQMAESDTYVIFVDPVYRDDYASTLESSLEEQSGQEVTVLHLYLLVGPMDDLDLLGQMEQNLENLAVGLGASMA
jgi:zinc transport system substrate-binding protein